jgi:hypothetical protein
MSRASKIVPFDIYRKKFEIQNFKQINNHKNKENPFPEENTVAKIYSAINLKNYDLLYQLLNRLPNFENIIELYISSVEELSKNEYTMTQLLAIAQLLYRLSNVNFVNVESPKPFPINSIQSIMNIYKNRELKKSKKIDAKIKEIVKNLISHYKIDIKSNNKYNNTSNGKLALKLQNILLSFIIDYTRPESSKPLEVQSIFPRGATKDQINQIMMKHQNMLPSIIGKNE